MKYVCSKNYKILCREDCYHAANIKEENAVWFDTIEEGIAYGCRPCKHCAPIDKITVDANEFKLFIIHDTGIAVGKIDTRDLMSKTLQIDKCERVIFRDKTLDFQFEIGHDQYKDIDTIIINGIKFKKEQ